MPQVIGAIVVIIIIWYVVVCLIPVLIQWIGAVLLWLLQAIILPALVFLPTVAVVMLTIAFLGASWIAVKNYFLAIHANIVPEPKNSALGTGIRGGLIGALTLFMALFYAAQLGGFGSLAYFGGLAAVNAITGYFDSIEFPGFEIHYPCG
jgi:uncharacterized membrane protein